MAVRQYIGARYAPRFVGLFDITQSYEALDVVDNGSGTSYITKKPTPAGTPLTDTNYWFLYGSTSGAIVNLQQQIDDMKDSDVPGSLQKQIDNNASDITALKTLVKRKFCFVGDSYSITNFGHTGWIDLVNTKMGLTRGVDSFDARDDVQYYGGSFGAGSFLTQLQALDTIVVDAPNTITDICVFAGTNEPANTDSDIRTGISNFMSYAKSHFPNAKVTIGFLGNSTNTSKANINGFCRCLEIYKKCGEWGAHYCTNIEYANSDLDNYYDSIHPNSYDKISTYIASGIIRGSVDILNQHEYNTTGASLNVSNLNGNIDANIYVNLSGLSGVTLNPAYSNAGTQIADFGTRINELKSDLIGYGKAVYGVPNGFHSIDVIIKIAVDGKLYLSVFNYNNNNGTAITINGNLIITMQKLTSKYLVAIPSWF